MQDREAVKGSEAQSGTGLERRSFLKMGSLLFLGGAVAHATTGDGVLGLLGDESTDVARLMFDKSPRARELAAWMASHGVTPDWSRAGIYTVVDASVAQGAPVHYLFGAAALDATAQVRASQSYFTNALRAREGQRVMVLHLADGASDRRGTIVVHDDGQAVGMMVGTHRPAPMPEWKPQNQKLRLS